ncbi:MAG: aminotransferase class I/II-fold pyridoxal phosphate-dependent enzyme [bacterium]|nr:aminotransferase class I/II-fold pyridoxal phosphate-dependent enzyme [bacterium]
MNISLLRVLQSAQGPSVIIQGKKYLNMCSNNYLGLANDPRVKNAAIKAIEKYGVGTASVRSLVGTNDLHVQLESKLARFKNVEETLVLTGGYVTNLAVVQTLLGKEDIVVSDEYNHASIIDAIRLSQVENKFVFKHNNHESLRSFFPAIKELTGTNRADGEKRRIMIITDGVFSMDGDIADLPGLVTIAHEIDAILVVDDAHGEGVLGSHGRGIVDHFGMNGQVDIEVGTLSKAFGVMGGFIAGDKKLISKFRTSARQFMFTNALSIPDTAALIEAVDILEESDERVKKLWDNTHLLKKGLIRAGFNIGQSKTPITPVMIWDEEKTRLFASELFEAGVLVAPITFPMVEKFKARLRLIPSSEHSIEDINSAVTIINAIGKKYV